MDEIWKDIVGYEGLYQVSNMGRVRSKERIFESKGTGRYKRNAQILSLGKHSKGYLTAKSTGIKSQNISCVCQGKNRQAGGFRWEFIKNK